MFRVNVEEEIKEAIYKQIGVELSIEEVHMMKTVPDVTQKSEKMILCLQVKEQTILVPIKISDNGQDIIIGNINTIIWWQWGLP